MVGHSLGAHLMGKAGRTFTNQLPSHPLIGRVTGMDPAGPRFFDGPILSAIPELAENILTPESAQFVDVIHTDGALKPGAVWLPPRLGALVQLGHIDFYPSGGSIQPGCSCDWIDCGPDALPAGCIEGRLVIRRLSFFRHLQS